MKNLKKLCAISIITALYVVLGAFLKINLIGNIQIDLGYVAFSVAICEFGVWGAVVGTVGCMIESILFSAYGLSVGWAVANAIIGVGCGLVFRSTEKFWLRIIAIVVFAALGLLFVKTAIECALYSIPVVVKIHKSAVAFVVDSVVMVIGLFVHRRVSKYIRSPQM